MVYPENFETKIKFDKIRQLISGNSLSDMGRELVNDIAFSSNAEWIRTALAETAEFMRICQEEDDFPVSYYHDARPFLARIRVEGLFLEVNELVVLKNSLESIERHHPFLQQQTGTIPPSGSTYRRYSGISLHSATSGFHRVQVRHDKRLRLPRPWKYPAQHREKTIRNIPPYAILIAKGTRRRLGGQGHEHLHPRRQNGNPRPLGFQAENKRHRAR